MILTALLYFPLVWSVIDALKWPTNIPRCVRDKPKLNQCLEKAVTVALKEWKLGDEDLKLPSFDPLLLGNMNLGSTDGALPLKFEFLNPTYSGLSSSIVNETRYDFSTNEMTMKWLTPHTFSKGKYAINGLLLVLPVNSTGSFTADIYDFLIKISVKMIPNPDRPGFVIPDVSFKKLYFKKCILKFDNLFPGNAELGESLNKIVNRSIRILERAFEVPFEKFMSQLFKEKLIPFFDKVPFDVMFPKTEDDMKVEF